jgi:hypothetical protein
MYHVTAIFAAVRSFFAAMLRERLFLPLHQFVSFRYISPALLIRSGFD